MSRSRSTFREYDRQVVAIGTLRLIEEAVRVTSHGDRPVRFHQAGSSECSVPPRHRKAKGPRFTHEFLRRQQRRALKSRSTTAKRMAFSSATYLFNHESRRGETFVTRKMTRAVGRIAQGLQDKLYLGENSKRSAIWGFHRRLCRGHAADAAAAEAQRLRHRHRGGA